MARRCRCRATSASRAVANSTGGSSTRRYTTRVRPLSGRPASARASGRAPAATAPRSRPLRPPRCACTAAASCCTVVMIGRSIGGRRGPDLVAVVPRGRAARGVDDHVDLAGDDPLRRSSARRPGPGPLLCLRTSVLADPVAAQHARGAVGGQHLEPQVDQPLHREDHRPLVAVRDRDEDPARRRQPAVGRGLATWRTPAGSRRRCPSPRRSSASPARAGCRRRGPAGCGTA